MSNNRPYSSNLTEIYYKVEKTPGVNPLILPWNRLRMRSHSLTIGAEVSVKRNLKTKRSAANVDIRQGAVQGSISCELTPRDMDIMFQASLRNIWNGKQLNQGSINQTFSFLLVHRNNSGAPQYALALGCKISKASFSFQINSIVSFSFNIVGTRAEMDFVPSSKQLLIDAKGGRTPFIGRDGLLTIDGKKCLVTSFTGSFGYNVDIVKRVSLAHPIALRDGSFDASGEITAAYLDNSLHRPYAEETSFELEFALQYNKYRYIFTFPNCIFSEVTSPSSGQGAVIVNATVKPLYSKTRGSTVIIKRQEISP